MNQAAHTWSNMTLVSDASVLLRDIAGDAATKAAGRVNPSDDQLSQIDQPAEDNTWHETPNFGEMKSNMQSKVPIGKKDVKDAAGNASNTADSTAQQSQEGKGSADAQKGAKAGAQNFKNNLSSRFDDDQKEKMRAYRERSRNYFEEKVPKNRRDQIIFRLKKMIVEIQTHQDCRCLYQEVLKGPPR